MKAREIKEGHIYEAKVSNKLVLVRVDQLPDDFASYRNTYVCTNMVTGRNCYMKTAGRFRRPATEKEVENLRHNG